ncbi:hypothetical protein AVEN_96202-1 [Araneus ventricosus]|uniref:Uncharacterized protein n=1 Tax=Araneus ventricosus TaxID=182803 RepID=A0A4Y2I3T8_ARAVE|nr:hypothetical protein AVEN_96202-1 [Araneus ventricosus]
MRRNEDRRETHISFIFVLRQKRAEIGSLILTKYLKNPHLSRNDPSVINNLPEFQLTSTSFLQSETSAEKTPFCSKHHSGTADFWKLQQWKTADALLRNQRMLF